MKRVAISWPIIRAGREREPSAMYNIETQSQPTMYFIGVSTSQSSIMRVFPLWMKEWGAPKSACKAWT